MHKAKVKENYKGSSFTPGQEVIVGPTIWNRGTHYYVYRLDVFWKGSFEIDMFDVFEEVEFEQKQEVQAIDFQDEQGQLLFDL